MKFWFLSFVLSFGFFSSQNSAYKLLLHHQLPYRHSSLYGCTGEPVAKKNPLVFDDCRPNSRTVELIIPMCSLIKYNNERQLFHFKALSDNEIYYFNAFSFKKKKKYLCDHDVPTVNIVAWFFYRRLDRYYTYHFR